MVEAHFGYARRLSVMIGSLHFISFFVVWISQVVALCSTTLSTGGLEGHS